MTEVTQQDAALKVCTLCQSPLPASEFGCWTRYRIRGEPSSVQIYISRICKKCCSNKSKTYRNGGFRNRLARAMSTAKFRAKSEQLAFDLNIDFLLVLLEEQQSRCRYTGRILQFSSGPDLVSIDREDPKQGYTQTNVVLCCWLINRFKSDLSAIEFTEICKQVASWCFSESLVS